MKPTPILWLIVVLTVIASARAQQSTSPYPPSPVIQSITWHWDTYRTAAPGSDLWPVTWAADDNLYLAWGDGGGFGGTDQDGRVALGFARIEGPPEHFTGININGGKTPEHPASFPKNGKVGGILAVDDRLYAWLNTQNGKWPDVDQALIISHDHGATWKQSDWVFPRGAGNFKPGTFLQFGKGYSGLPKAIDGYVYFYGQKQGERRGMFMGRVRPDRLEDRRAYEFFTGLEHDHPTWSADVQQARPISSAEAGDLAGIVYVAPLKRYLLTSFHTGPGQLGIFDAPQPWGPWTTVAWYDHWADMGTAGEGLTCSFPTKWISPDGQTLWCIFSAYGPGAKEGRNAHDKFNLVKATIQLRH